jgi:hypothetical protein
VGVCDLSNFFRQKACHRYGVKIIFLLSLYSDAEYPELCAKLIGVKYSGALTRFKGSFFGMEDTIMVQPCSPQSSTGTGLQGQGNTTGTRTSQAHNFFAGMKLRPMTGSDHSKIVFSVMQRLGLESTSKPMSKQRITIGSRPSRLDASTKYSHDEIREAVERRAKEIMISPGMQKMYVDLYLKQMEGKTLKYADAYAQAYVSLLEKNSGLEAAPGGKDILEGFAEACAKGATKTIMGMGIGSARRAAASGKTFLRENYPGVAMPIVISEYAPPPFRHISKPDSAESQTEVVPDSQKAETEQLKDSPSLRGDQQTPESGSAELQTEFAPGSQEAEILNFFRKKLKDSPSLKDNPERQEVLAGIASRAYMSKTKLLREQGEPEENLPRLAGAYARGFISAWSRGTTLESTRKAGEREMQKEKMLNALKDIGLTKEVKQDLSSKYARAYTDSLSKEPNPESVGALERAHDQGKAAIVQTLADLSTERTTFGPVIEEAIDSLAPAELQTEFAPGSQEAEIINFFREKLKDSPSLKDNPQGQEIYAEGASLAYMSKMKLLREQGEPEKSLPRLVDAYARGFISAVGRGANLKSAEKAGEREMQKEKMLNALKDTGLTEEVKQDLSSKYASAYTDFLSKEPNPESVGALEKAHDQGKAAIVQTLADLPTERTTFGPRIEEAIDSLEPAEFQERKKYFKDGAPDKLKTPDTEIKLEDFAWFATQKYFQGMEELSKRQMLKDDKEFLAEVFAKACAEWKLAHQEATIEKIVEAGHLAMREAEERLKGIK